MVRPFAADPAPMAAAHGIKTGRCCFCDIALDTPESKAVGYGPVCAKNFGLAWGKRAAKAAQASDTAAIEAHAERREREIEARMEARADREQTARDESNKFSARAGMETFANRNADRWSES